MMPIVFLTIIAIILLAVIGIAACCTRGGNSLSRPTSSPGDPEQAAAENRNHPSYPPANGTIQGLEGGAGAEGGLELSNLTHL